MNNKNKRKAKMFEAINEELKKLFNNNPLDLPTSPLGIAEYATIIKVIDSISVLSEQTIEKDNCEWDYFANKWHSLLASHRVDKPLAELDTFHNVYESLLKNWEKAKSSPYTYRCIASLIRMLGEEQG